MVLFATGTISSRFRICQQKNIHRKLEAETFAYWRCFICNGVIRRNLRGRGNDSGITGQKGFANSPEPANSMKSRARHCRLSGWFIYFIFGEKQIDPRPIKRLISQFPAASFGVVSYIGQSAAARSCRAHAQGYPSQLQAEVTIGSQVQKRIRPNRRRGNLIAPTSAERFPCLP